MKRLKPVIVISGFISLVSFSLPFSVTAFNDNAHRALSRGAVKPNISNLDNYLLTVLRYEFFPNGVTKQLNDGDKGRVQDLIAEVGAIDEDWLTPNFQGHNTNFLD